MVLLPCASAVARGGRSVRIGLGQFSATSSLGPKPQVEILDLREELRKATIDGRFFMGRICASNLKRGAARRNTLKQAGHGLETGVVDNLLS